MLQDLNSESLLIFGVRSKDAFGCVGRASYTVSNSGLYVWWGAGEMVVKCLLCKHEGLRLIPRTRVKKLGRVGSTYNPNTGEVEADRFLGLPDQPAQPNL